MYLCFYPYVAPSGAICVLGGFLSIRCPERGKWYSRGYLFSIHTLPLTGQYVFWVYLCFYPYVAPNGAEAFGCVSVSIHTLPRAGQYVFWGDSYPYITPNGAEAFGCVSVSIHTLPLTGQRLLRGSLFLSIRCP